MITAPMTHWPSNIVKSMRVWRVEITAIRPHVINDTNHCRDSTKLASHEHMKYVFRGTNVWKCGRRSTVAPSRFQLAAHRLSFAFNLNRNTSRIGSPQVAAVCLTWFHQPTSWTDANEREIAAARARRNENRPTLMREYMCRDRCIGDDNNVGESSEPCACRCECECGCVAHV